MRCIMINVAHQGKDVFCHLQPSLNFKHGSLPTPTPPPQGQVLWQARILESNESWNMSGSMGWMRVYGLNALAFNGAASPNDGNRPVPTGFPHWKNVSRLQKWRLKFWVWGCCFIYVVYPDAMSLTFFKRHLFKASRFKNLLGNSWNLFA